MPADRKQGQTGFLEASFLGRLKTFYFLPLREKSNRFLPLIIAVMAYLTLLGTSSGLAIFNATNAWSTDLSQVMTVQIVHPDPAERERQTRAVIDVLGNTVGVVEARAIPTEDLNALLEPWLGVGNVTDDLPLPAMVSVTLRQGAHVDAAALNVRLQARAPNASVDDHQQWIGQLKSLSNMVQSAVFFSILLIVLTTVAMVIFATKSALAAHRETVEIVHLIGAKDSLIASEFRKLFMLHGFKGGIIGLGGALLTIALFMYLANRIGGGLLPQLDLTPGQITILALVPFMTSFLSMWTADITVRHALGKMV